MLVEQNERAFDFVQGGYGYNDEDNFRAKREENRRRFPFRQQSGPRRPIGYGRDDRHRRKQVNYKGRRTISSFNSQPNAWGDRKFA